MKKPICWRTSASTPAKSHINGATPLCSSSTLIPAPSLQLKLLPDAKFSMS
eukprot:m.114432 g.114432  ORF g.114432 m.114432 type:complete len:51 (+) comp13052_c1_seq3:195-347(+)